VTHWIGDARRAAEKLQGALASSCERIEIAGSIRRRVDQVKDIELVAVPKIVQADAGDLWGSQEPSDLLALTLQSLRHSGFLVPRVGERTQYLVFEGIPVDLFIVRPQKCGQCGIILYNDATTSERDVRDVREDIHGPRLPSAPVLQPELCSEGTSESAPSREVDRMGPSDVEAWRDHGFGLRGSASPAAPEGEYQGSNAGAPSRHGAAPSAVSRPAGEGASPERGQDGQPDREPANRDPGPADFSHQLVTDCQRFFRKVRDGQLLDAYQQPIPCPEEADFFRNVGQPWLDPWDRRADRVHLSQPTRSAA
jgi:hypothetical protein